MEYLLDVFPGISHEDAARANVELRWNIVQQSRQRVTAAWQRLLQGRTQMQRTLQSVILFAELMRWRCMGTGVSIEVALRVLEFLVPNEVCVNLPPCLRFCNGPSILHREYLAHRIRAEDHELLDLRFDLMVALHPQAFIFARLQTLASIVARRIGHLPDTVLAFAAIPVVVTLLQDAAIVEAVASADSDADAEGDFESEPA
jgi:hypothetical protein